MAAFPMDSYNSRRIRGRGDCGEGISAAMKIERIELLHVRLPLIHCHQTSFGRSYNNETLIVRISSGGAVGWGEVCA